MAARLCLAILLAAAGQALPAQETTAAELVWIAAAAEDPSALRRRLAEECQTRCEQGYQRCLIQFSSDWSRCQLTRTVCHSACPFKAGSPHPQ